MVKGDFGIQLQYGVGFDLSANTGLKLVFTRPDATVLTVTNPSVTISASPISTPAGNFSGNQYFLYTFVNGDVTVAGNWSVRATYNASNVQLTSEPVVFTVDP